MLGTTGGGHDGSSIWHNWLKIAANALALSFDVLGSSIIEDGVFVDSSPPMLVLAGPPAFSIKPVLILWLDGVPDHLVADFAGVQFCCYYRPQRDNINIATLGKRPCLGKLTLISTGVQKSKGYFIE
eukprot:g39641.t1